MDKYRGRFIKYRRDNDYSQLDVQRTPEKYSHESYSKDHKP